MVGAAESRRTRMGALQEAPLRVLPRGSFARLGAALERMGVDASVLAPDEPLPGAGASLLVHGNATAARRRLEPLRDVPPSDRPRVVLWHVEPLPLPPTAGFRRQRRGLRELGKVVLRDERATDPATNLKTLLQLSRADVLGRVAVTSVGAAELLRAYGVEAVVVPYGYEKGMGDDMGHERDLGVVFLGASDVPRRRRLLKALARAGLDVTTAGGWGDRGVWGAERTSLLNRARIVLNLSRYPGQFSGFRLVLGMANGALVLSEHMYRPEPFVDGVHFVSGTLGEMPELAKRYLADEEERQRIATAGHEFVTTTLTLERSLRTILELARA